VEKTLRRRDGGLRPRYYLLVRTVLAALLAMTAAADAAAASISGRVTEAGSGRPLARAIVTLVSVSEQSAAVTDGDGRYQFPRVTAGRYAVLAEPGEHRATHLLQWYGEAGPGLRGAPPRYPLTVAADAALTGIDVPLVPALAIEGRVLAPWDEPLANAEVRVTRPDGSNVLVYPAFSDDLGNYRVYGLAAGRYHVCARLETFDMLERASAPIVKTCYPATVVEREAADVTLSTADAVGIDIRVQRVGGRSVSGSVTDATSSPADGAMVTAFSLDGQMRSATAIVREGAFTLGNLVPGRYLVAASIGGRQPSDPNPAAREREVGTVTVDVTAVDASGLSIALSKPARIMGRVVFENTQTPPSNARGLTIYTVPRDDPWMFDRVPFGVVRPDWTFELADVYRWPLHVRPARLPDGWAIRSVRSGDRDITHVTIDLTTLSAPLEVVLTNRVARASVRVAVAQGQGASDYRLFVLPAARDTWQTAVRLVEASPDPDGRVTAESMLPGEYLFAAVSPSDALLVLRDRSRIDALASVATRVTMVEGDTPGIELRLVALPEKR
jgi:hypothetical protein